MSIPAHRYFKRTKPPSPVGPRQDLKKKLNHATPHRLGRRASSLPDRNIGTRDSDDSDEDLPDVVANFRDCSPPRKRLYGSAEALHSQLCVAYVSPLNLESEEGEIPRRIGDKSEGVTHSGYLDAASHDDLRGRCIVAELALLHASRKVGELRNVLAKSGYEGLYLIQVGFNQDILRSGQGLLQEIYVSLEYGVYPAQVEEIADAMDPFPVAIYMPNKSPYYVPSKYEEDTWNAWTKYGIFRPDVCDAKMVDTLPSSGSDNIPASPYPTSGGRKLNDSFTDHRNTSGDKNNGDEEDSEDRNGKDKGKSRNDLASLRVEAQLPNEWSTRTVNIPFSSTLSLPCGKDRYFDKLHTNAYIDIKMEDNPDSKSPPPGTSWGGPWLEAKFTLLTSEILLNPRVNLNYHIGFAQIRISMSGRDIPYLDYSPKTLPFDNDDVKVVTERDMTFNASATFGVSPSFQVGGKVRRGFRQEQSHRRWGVTPYQLSSHPDRAGEPGKSVMWKYVHNDKSYPPQTQHTFDPNPTATFGFSHASSRMRKLEVEVVTNYSCTTPAQTSFNRLIKIVRPKSKPGLPAFSNFLHQVSVTLDLDNVKGPHEYTTELGVEDELPIGAEAGSISKVLKNNTGVSGGQVLLERALYGLVSLTEDERKEFVYGPNPWPLRNSLGTREAAEPWGEIYSSSPGENGA